MSVIPPRRRDRGFNGCAATNAFVKRLATPNAVSAGAWALLWLAFSYAAAALLDRAIAFSPWLGVAVTVLVLMPVAVSQRALELFNHDGGHFNVAGRHHAVLNDVLTALLAAWPVMQTVAGYRRSHAPHHGDYGGADDPCLKRMNARTITAQMRGSALRVLAWAVRRWPTEVSSYYKVILTSPKAFLLGAAWHVLFWIAPAALIVGPARALLLWLLAWLLPFVTALPIIRAIAEAEEHDYDRTDANPTGGGGAAGALTAGSEFTTTNSNLGWLHRLVIHPWHDGYHGIHHIYQHVPQYRHPRLHAYLLAHEPRYAEAAMLRHDLLAAAASQKESHYAAH